MRRGAWYIVTQKTLCVMHDGKHGRWGMKTQMIEWRLLYGAHCVRTLFRSRKCGSALVERIDRVREILYGLKFSDQTLKR